MPVSVKLVPRKAFIKKDGTSALYLRVIIDRKSKSYRLNYYIDPSKWDWNKGIMKGSMPYVNQINTYISNEIARANNFIFQIQNEGKSVTHSEFENLYFSKNKMDYYTFANQYINQNTGKFSGSYINQLKSELSKLNKFKSSLFFNEITHTFLVEYEHYMRTELNNSTNTVFKTLKRMKTIINEAIRQDERIINRNPFITYKLKTEPTNRNYLTKNEFEALYNMREELTGKTANVLNHFLFSCLTGLRYQDIVDLKFKNIIDNSYIEIIMNKTNEQIIIPLSSKALQILPERGKPDENVFAVYSNQKTNDYLKLVIEKADIQKTISFHCSRHTFATMALNNGIPLEVVQKLLGHSMIRTTQIYGKIVNDTIFEQMKKME